MTVQSTVDLHVHSTASDGRHPPATVVHLAVEAGLRAVALTDHDTLDGIGEARRAAEETPLRVIAGCEFSVAAWFGELHLLAYFLPLDEPEIQVLCDRQREERAARAQRILGRLAELGVPVSSEAVEREAAGAGIARPHIARAMVAEGQAGSVTEAFDRFLSDRGPACVAKVLPDVTDVCDLVRAHGGVTSAAHLKDRAGKRTVARLRDAGVDGVEVLHPSHDATIVRALEGHAARFGLLRSGGSDWHGTGDHRRGGLGSQPVPAAWLDELEAAHVARVRAGS